MKIGIDIGGSHIAIALVNEEGKILEKMKQTQKIQKMQKYLQKNIL